jgi:hypothetical protein
MEGDDEGTSRDDDEGTSREPGFRRAALRPPPLSGVIEAGKARTSLRRAGDSGTRACSQSAAGDVGADHLAAYSKGYAWNQQPPLSSSPSHTNKAQLLLWIDFIRLQSGAPQIPVGALAAAKRDEVSALRNVEIEHSTGYSDFCSSINRLPASPLGGATGGRGASPGRRAADAPHTTTSPMFHRGRAGKPVNSISRRPATAAARRDCAGDRRRAASPGSDRLRASSPCPSTYSRPRSPTEPLVFTDTLRSWGFRPREHEGSLSRNPSLRNLCPSPAANKSDASERCIAQWFVDTSLANDAPPTSTSPTHAKAAGSRGPVAMSRCYSRSGMSSGCGSPVLRGSPTGMAALCVEPAAISSVFLAQEFHQSDVVASCQNDDLRARPDHARVGRGVPGQDRRNDEIKIDVPAHGEQKRGRTSPPPIYGCSDTENQARTVGSPGRARAAGRVSF